MKVPLKGPGVEREFAERFVEEAQATARLQHPGIVPVYEIGLIGPLSSEGAITGRDAKLDDEGKLFFTMKLVRGRTLARVIEQARAGDPETAPSFTPYRLVQLFVEVCLAVFYAHERGVVHRDLKPQNVMIGRYGEVQVMDWGVAKVLARAQDRLRLRLKERATILAPVTQGFPFLGWRIYPGMTRLRPENLRRTRRRRARRAWEQRTGRIDEGQLADAVRSVAEHLAHGSTLALRQKMFAGP